MTIGDLENAKRRALNILDKWLDVTGVIDKRSPYYWELQGVVEDAVHYGAQDAAGCYEPLESERKG